MAPDQSKSTSGGNKPKPGGQGGSPGQSAKDKSRAQSRPVAGKAPAGKGGKAAGTGGGKGGNTPRPGRPTAPAPQPRRFSGAMMAWGAVGLVVIIVAVLVIVKVTSSSSTNTSYTPTVAAPASVVHDVTSIPTSVYNTVGVNYPSSAQPVSQPIVLKNQPALTLDGKSPAMLYLGAEYCPYCAAERWAMTAALSRFGTWSNLKITASSHTDVFADTHTFSYHGATFTSPYLSFFSIEQYTNIPTSGGGYTALESPTKEEAKVIAKYSNPTYVPGATAGEVSYPFVDIGNVALISGASYSPGILANQTWQEIAGNLDDPTNPVTQSIVATANYMTAAICASTKGAPSSVCTSPGVTAAAKALKLS